jgi:phage-related protein
MAITIPIITEFAGAGIDKAVKQFKQLETAGEKASFAIKKAAVPAAAALAGLATVGLDFAKAAADDAQSAALLARQLKNSTLATDKQIAGNEKFITSVSMSAAVADDELRPALQKLATGTGSLELSQKLLGTALNVSAATGKSVVDVADALSKGYAGNMKALKSLSPELAALIKDHASFDEVTTRLDANYKGMAETVANSAGGSFKKLGIALSETKESIGAALLPVVQVMAEKFAAIGQLAQENSGLFVTLGVVIGGIALAVVTVNTALKVYEAYTKLVAAATYLWNAALAANPLVLLGIAIAAVVAALVIAYTKFEAFRNLVDTLFNGMKTGFKVVVDVIRGYIETLVGFYKGLFNGIADIWNNTVGKLSFKIPGWVPVIGGKGFEVPNIPKLAEGGIVTSPTIAMIGERGPEAVIPLSGRNAPAMGNNITINVNGGDPNAVVSALRTYMRQNGSVPIKVSNIY